MTVAASIEKEVELKTAQKMIEKGYSIQDIIEITGLSKQEIEKLIDKK